jgi:hypothetical protein
MEVFVAEHDDPAIGKPDALHKSRDKIAGSYSVLVTDDIQPSLPSVSLSRSTTSPRFVEISEELSPYA